VSVAEPERLISREEVLATIFLIADIATEARTIRRLLEDDGEAEEEQEGTG
jgi:hypothetical protein